jgi:phage shock protein PspC (stress-responsive transcriptional regulator)
MDLSLYRSQRDAWIGGVCGGLAAYLGIDSILVRLFFVLLALTGHGVGLLIYLLLWLIIPLKGMRKITLPDTVRSSSGELVAQTHALRAEVRRWLHQPRAQLHLLLGLTLFALGALRLLQTPHLPWLRWLDFEILWPLLLIAFGAALLLRRSPC